MSIFVLFHGWTRISADLLFHAGRPTEVIGGGASSRRQSIFFSSSSLSTSTPSTPPPLPTSPGKKSGSKWTLFDILGRMGDRKGKLRVKA